MADVRGDGRKVWIIPDGELPPKGEGEIEGHESLLILNTSPEDANILLDLYFPEREPVLGIPLLVAAERVRCFRMDKPIGPDSYQVPFGQYALRIRSSVPVVVQFGRADVRQANLAYYCTLGFPSC